MLLTRDYTLRTTLLNFAYVSLLQCTNTYPDLGGRSCPRFLGNLYGLSWTPECDGHYNVPPTLLPISSMHRVVICCIYLSKDLAPASYPCLPPTSLSVTLLPVLHVPVTQDCFPSSG